MAAGKFDWRMPLPTHGDITIKGPFDPQDSAVDAAKVLFLIVQGEGEDPVIVDGEGTWKRPNGKWSGTVPRTGLQEGHARGIALAIVIKPHEVVDGRFEPPAIETLTWCATFRFE